MSSPARYEHHAYVLQGKDVARRRLKELCWAARERRIGASTVSGDAVLAAVDALPDHTLFYRLSEEQRKPLEAFMLQAEIEHHAAEAAKAIEEHYPHLAKEP